MNRSEKPVMSFDVLNPPKFTTVWNGGICHIFSDCILFALKMVARSESNRLFIAYFSPTPVTISRINNIPNSPAQSLQMQQSQRSPGTFQYRM